MEPDHISIRGAREHNLKSIDVVIPKKKLVVFTGVSGSGKSSLAFDTLYAEGQRRYVESLSAYARQFLGRMEKPAFDSARGLSPTISIEQKTTGTNPRSTVGTITEILDYLRVLYARAGVQHCHRCGGPVQGQTAQQIAAEIAAFPEGTRAIVLAPLVVNRKGEHRDVIEAARRDGFVRLRVDGKIVESERLTALDKKKKHHVEAVVDRLVVKKDARSRITDSVEAALRAGGGTLLVSTDSGHRTFSESKSCPHCNLSFPELSPAAFSFNSPQGMCADCNGLGTRVQIDPALVVPDESLSIDGGAIACWGPEASKKTGWAHGFRGQILKHLGIDAKRPYAKIPAKQRHALLYGTGEKKYRVGWTSKSGKGSFDMTWEGVVHRLMRRFSATKSESAKQWYAQYMSDTPCTTCKGTRLRAESAAVRVAGKTLVEVSAMTVEDARRFYSELKLSGEAREIAREVLKEINGRLGFLAAVGLGYLSLDRPGPSLSGGEAQRIRLASQVGSDLTGVIYVLDEPSIGLHQRDNRKLLDTLCRMRDIGNTVVVVEHDEETIRAADHVIDFGPGAGVQGGRVVHAGTPESLANDPNSLTGAYLSGLRAIPVPELRRTPTGSLRVVGATEHNLKNIDVAFPLGVMTAVTGVSGAGKSSLVNGILHPALARLLNGATTEHPGRHKKIEGVAQLDKVIAIDQRAIGRTPRSNPATYIKVFDEIRSLFAELPDARARGYSPGRFSFNVKGGRCEACEGDGVRCIEMHFLPDVYVRCEECQGQRFNHATLEVRYRGKSIADVLELTVAEARELFAAHPHIAAQLELLAEVGVDYLHLGQPSPTLSGGEAQRIKLARELGRKATGRTLYILDEPTTGLHFDDVKKLLSVLQRLVDAGNTVVVIEHNLDVVKSADHVIDLGPEGGPEGGRVVAEGTPEAVATVEASHTGRYLAGLLGPRAAPRTKVPPARVAPRSTSRSASRRAAAG